MKKSLFLMIVFAGLISFYSSVLVAQSGSRVVIPRSRSLARQQPTLQRQQSSAPTRARVKSNEDRFQKSLVQLGLSTNRSANQNQNRLAFKRAQHDFQSLRNKNVAPSQLGLQQIPFRLDNKSLDRNNRRARWPSALLSDELIGITEIIDSAMVAAIITDEMSAEDFIDELKKLNVELNSAAVRGDVTSTRFARARRFISGLAHEVRSSGLIM